MYILWVMTFPEAVGILIVMLLIVVLLLTRWRQRRVLQLALPSLAPSDIIANGRLLTLEQTGVYMNRQPLMRIKILVMCKYGGDFVLEIREVLSAREILQLQRQGHVRVRYNRTNPEKAVLMKTK
ncbi:MAG: hypothetical protein GXC78_18380 [Chitinophagaceae bacterium]|nr:hypothetical protein [Chitinophagaceae bacterium]